MQVPAGQVNFRGSLPCSVSNVLELMLHPVGISLVSLTFCITSLHGIHKLRFILKFLIDLMVFSISPVILPWLSRSWHRLAKVHSNFHEIS